MSFKCLQQSVSTLRACVVTGDTNRAGWLNRQRTRLFWVMSDSSFSNHCSTIRHYVVRHWDCRETDTKTSIIDSNRQAANNWGSSKLILVVEWRYVCAAARDGHHVPGDKDKARWKWFVQHLTLPLYPKERTSALVEKEAGWTPRTSLDDLNERKISSPCRNSNSGSSSR